jgi:hypothetical protein
LFTPVRRSGVQNSVPIRRVRGAYSREAVDTDVPPTHHDASFDPLGVRRCDLDHRVTGTLQI